jgi:hypothetical protein
MENLLLPFSGFANPNSGKRKDGIKPFRQGMFPD